MTSAALRAEVVAIGSELTTGAKLDTNSQWLSQRLAEIGIAVQFHTTVADQLDDNVAVLRTALERADFVVVSGGLGPTLDDLTREALARVLNVPLELHEPSLAAIRAMFARRQREMPERNVAQAMFPQGTEPLPNPRGTAPGIWAELSRPGRVPCRLVALPGVPSEMRPMFEQQVAPRWQPLAGGQVIRTARLNCFGLGESAAEELLGDLTARGRNPEVGITVHEATITLRIVAQGESAAECEEKIASTAALARERLGTYIFGTEDETLEEVVVRALCRRDRSLATAEAGAAGLLAHWLSNVPGAEQVLTGSLVFPAHHRSLVSYSDADDVEPTPRELATLIARRAADQFDAHYSLVLMRELPSAQSEPEAPIEPTASRMVAVLLEQDRLIEAAHIHWTGDPAIAHSRAAKTALNLLRIALLS